jgi:hypothetical protein
MNADDERHLEERLRAHYADRAGREPLPPSEEWAGPSAATVRPMRRAGQPMWATLPRGVLVGLAAALALIAGIAVVLTAEDDPSELEMADTTEGSSTTPSDSAVVLGGSTVDTGSQVTADPATATSSSLGPTGPVVVVAVQGVLGWWDGGGWVRSDSGEAPPVAGGEHYRVVRVDGVDGTAEGGTPSAPDELCGAPAIALDPALASWTEANDANTRDEPIAVGGSHELRPRAVELLDPASDTYVAAAREVVAGLGIEDASPDVTQVVRTDLEGDGTDEVLVSARRTSDVGPGYGGPGDYAVVFLRRVVDGDEIETTVVTHSVNESTPEAPSPYVNWASVLAIADLNGDGRTEVVLARGYYEGSSTEVYEVNADGTTSEVLATGCGA